MCIKCYAIYHKCCIPKFQKSIRFIKDNQLVCCDEDESFVSDRDEVRDVLEKTIHDLTEESDLKNKYIKKIKDDREAFFQEAMKREADMSELLKRQEQLIEELNNQITDLKKEININLNSKKMTNTIGTQTIFKIKKDASTLTDIPCRTDKKLSACKETKTLSKPDNVHKILNSNNSQIVHRERNNENTMTMYIFQCLIYIKENLNQYITHDKIHEHSTRNKNKRNITFDFLRLSKTRNGTSYFSIKFFNVLPVAVQELESNRFKTLIKRFLLDNAFYDFDEFLLADFSMTL